MTPRASTLYPKIHSFESEYARSHLRQTEHIRNHPIAESERYVAVPTIGALVCGWVLVVPKKPTLCVGSLSSHGLSELDSFVDDVVHLVEAAYGSCAIFEHGPALPSTRVGCGVDYAHVHVVPTSIDVLSGAQQFLPDVPWREVEDYHEAKLAHDQGLPYLFLRQETFNEKAWLATSHEGFPSQLFRRVIATALGRPDEFDWKSHPNLTNMERTCEALSHVAVSS